MTLDELIGLLARAREKVSGDTQVGIEVSAYYGRDAQGIIDVEFESRIVRTVSYVNDDPLGDETIEDKSKVTIFIE